MYQMERRTATDRYLRLYRQLYDFDIKNVNVLELQDIAFELDIELLEGKSEDILMKMQYIARKSYLYNWSLELTPETATESELMNLAESLNIKEFVGTPEEIILKLRLEAAALYDIEKGDPFFSEIPPTPININKVFINEAKLGHKKMIENFLKRGGVDIKSINEGLYQVSIKGYNDVAQLLINAGATNINECLSLATWNRRNVIVSALISAGATNITSALIDAAYRGHSSVVKQLLTAGNLRNITIDFDYVIEIAKKQKKYDVVELLQKLKH